MSIPRAYGNYQDLLADPDVQVVHNCTPNHLHFAVNRDILSKRLMDLEGYGFKAIILDESHYIKEPKSKRSKMAKLLCV